MSAIIDIIPRTRETVKKKRRNSAKTGRFWGRRYNIKYGVDQVKLFVTGAVMSNEPIAGAMIMTFDEMKAAIDVAKMQ